MIKVSVLVPIYNVEKYLDKCLQSLCNQTLQEMEIICINDGSTDSSRQVIEHYAKIDKRIVVIDKKNTGYGNSMNVGLDRASGEYIGIVESDDFIEPDMMERLYLEAKLYTLDIVKSNCFLYLDNNGIEQNQEINIFDDLPINETIIPIEKPELFIKLQTIWSALYAKDFLIRNGIRFNETPGASYQDVSFSFQVFACAKKVRLLQDAYYHYRINNLNSSVKAPNKVFCICDELEYINTFIEKREEKREILRWIASRLGYRVLMENYRVLASAFQYALFLKIVEYLTKYREKGYIYGTIWDKKAVDEVYQILDNPNSYFMETAKSFEDERVKSGSCLNQQIYGNAVFDCVQENEYIIIYGAGKIGQEMLTCLLNLGHSKEKIFFAVTNMDKNKHSIEGILVQEIDAYQKWKEYAMVVVAVKGQYQFEILELLEKKRFINVVVVDDIVRNSMKKLLK